MICLQPAFCIDLEIVYVTYILPQMFPYIYICVYVLSRHVLAGEASNEKD